VSSRRWSLVVAVGALLIALALIATPAGAAIRRSPTQAPANTVVDGPSAAIAGLSGMAIARDGTGALVYLRNDTGAAHVFVSLLRNGVFQTPQQVDTGLAGASTQPVVAVTNNGLTQIAFVNAGTLYTVSAANVLTPLTAPVAIAGGASNPSLSLSVYGKGYLAFTGMGAGGHDVRYAALVSGPWVLSASPLDQSPAADAGAGTARPQVVCAGDGTGITTWGESGHIFARRVLGTTPSTTVLQADPSSFAGVGEVSADLPVVAAGGDSSYATVAFHEILGSGGAGQSRVLVNRLHASRFDGVSGADNLTTPGGEGASSPAVAVTEYGDGLITAAGDTSHNLFATALGSNDQPGGSSQVNSLGQISAPDAVPATAGTISTLIAWQQDNGGGAPAEIRIRYAPDGVDLNAEQVVSTPDLGPANAAQGLAAGGDISGDAAIAWVQGSGADTRIVTAQLFQGPRGFAPAAASAYARTAHPQFSWSPAGEQWGPLNYVVKVDGVPVGGTQATSLAPAAPLLQGRHIWQVSATNLAGLTVLARPATVFVDSVAPKVSARITGSHYLGATLTTTVTASDTPPLLPASHGSGVETLTLSWGDRTRNVGLGHVSRAVHVYRRTGRYRLTITAVDRAGNRTVVTRTVAVKPKPKKQKQTKGRHHAPIIRPARFGR
jgi:hypothetical protein